MDLGDELRRCGPLRKEERRRGKGERGVSWWGCGCGCGGSLRLLLLSERVGAWVLAVAVAALLTAFGLYMTIDGVVAEGRG